MLCIVSSFKSNINEIVEKFVSFGGKYILTQGTESGDFQESIDIAKQFNQTVHLYFVRSR
jgi:Tat protein secretion system quality control protein TatD with DNase activity